MTSNEISPLAIVHDSAMIGSNNTISDYARIGPGVRLGDNNLIGVGSLIGTPPETRGLNQKASSGREYGLHVGDNNVFREYVCVQLGEADTTRIGSRNYFLSHSVIGHDSQIAHETTISSNVTIGGHSSIHSRATIGIGSSIHQYSTVGIGSMVGMNTAVRRMVKNFVTINGNPAIAVGPNMTLLRKLGIQIEIIGDITSTLGPKELLKFFGQDGIQRPNTEVMTLLARDSDFITRSNQGPQ